MSYETGVHLRSVDDDCAHCGEAIEGAAAKHTSSGDLIHQELLRHGSCPGDQ